MSVHPDAGRPATSIPAPDIRGLLDAYRSTTPDPAVPAQRVSFGTSGHRGTSTTASFNEQHILAITQAICTYRSTSGITGPLFLGIDTHALSRPAYETALEVLAANGVDVFVDGRDGFAPTPAVSRAILVHNRGRSVDLADGIVITPSHNPPADGGFKYNPPHGGAADTNVTRAIQDEANRLLAGAMHEVQRAPFARARQAATTHAYDYVDRYVSDLGDVIDFAAIRAADVTLAVDPLGGAGVAYWPEIADRYRIPLEVLRADVDPAFPFMSLDWDGRIRMDPSSQYAMRHLIDLKQQFDVAWACDTDHDRHGIVARSTGLLNPNAYLAVAIDYLFTHRDRWSPGAGTGKTVVSSSMIDRVTSRLGRPLVEVPVGFKWFVNGLMDGTVAFAGEESAGATFLARDGAPWTTDKDGIILGLLAAEMTAVTGRDPGESYALLEAEFGTSYYERIDAAATPAQKAALLKLSGSDVAATELAGDAITAKLTEAPGNNASIGGLKVATDRGWFAARPSGTEDVYKLYAESFVSGEHLAAIQGEARTIITKALHGT